MTERFTTKEQKRKGCCNSWIPEFESFKKKMGEENSRKV